MWPAQTSVMPVIVARKAPVVIRSMQIPWLLVIRLKLRLVEHVWYVLCETTLVFMSTTANVFFFVF
jgi:hypothetical protein